MKKVITVLVIVVSLIALIFGAILIYSKYISMKFADLPGIVTVSNAALTDADGSNDIAITIDSRETIHEISPFIYGTSWANWLDILPPKKAVEMLNFPIIRFGGNDFSRFDPVTEIFYKPDKEEKLKHPIGEAAAWFAESGAEIILQINMLGIAIDPVTQERFPISTPEDAIGFIVKMKNDYGVEIKHVNLDNEPFIWFDTHKDLHPKSTSYDEYLEKFISYAKAVKEYDNTIMVMGPESCNPHFYCTSNSGEDAGKGVWLEYFLRACYEYEQEHGTRLLDVLSVHRYPIFRDPNRTEITASNQHILNAARDWWDEQYTDTIDPDPGNGLIPKLKRLIGEHYPGTKLAVTEYNLDYDSTIRYDPVIRAIWLADTLGIFARHGVDYANFWTLQGGGEQGLMTNGQFTVGGETYGEKRPSFYSFYLLSNFLRGTMVNAASSHDNIKVYGAVQGDTLNMIVINTDVENDYNCNIFSDHQSINSKSYLFKSKSITVFEINGDLLNIYRCDFAD